MRRVPVLLTTVALIGGGLAVAAPVTAEPGPRAGEHERIVAYWTPERVRSAVPKLPVLDGAPANHRPGHAGGGSGGDGSTSTSVTGAPWQGSTEPGKAGATTGKVLFTMKGSNYVCSGSSVERPSATSTGASIVLTAGHCLHDGDGKDTSWATNWMFIPAYHKGGSFTDCNSTSYGCWTSSGLTTTGNWFTSGRFADDAGFAVMSPGGKSGESRELAAVVGAQKISLNALGVGAPVHAFGYPAAKKYSGRELIYCAGSTQAGATLGTVGLACDMTGGSSGGPWLGSFTTVDGADTGVAQSVNSHIYRSIKDVMFGPVFDGQESDAYSLATGGAAGSAKKQ